MTAEQRAERLAQRDRIGAAHNQLDPETEAWLPVELQDVVTLRIEDDRTATISGLNDDWFLPCDWSLLDPEACE